MRGLILIAITVLALGQNSLAEDFKELEIRKQLEESLKEELAKRTSEQERQRLLWCLDRIKLTTIENESFNERKFLEALMENAHKSAAGEALLLRHSDYTVYGKTAGEFIADALIRSLDSDTLRTAAFEAIESVFGNGDDAVEAENTGHFTDDLESYPLSKDVVEELLDFAAPGTETEKFEREVRAANHEDAFVAVETELKADENLKKETCLDVQYVRQNISVIEEAIIEGSETKYRVTLYYRCPKPGTVNAP